MNYLLGFLIQLILYSTVWLMDEYTGLLVCMIMGFITGGILLFAVIIELVEKSKVPRSYFIWMGIACITPIVVATFFSIVYEGQFDWIDKG